MRNLIYNLYIVAISSMILFSYVSYTNLQEQVNVIILI